MLPTGWNYHSFQSGARLKHVQCENCPCKYVYQLKRNGEGVAHALFFLGGEAAKEKAAKDAADDLERQLRSQLDPVPCPACGWYQRRMQKLLRRRRGGWAIVLSGFLFVGSFLSVVARWSLSMQDFPSETGLRYAIPTAVVCAVLAWVFLEIAHRLEKNYDPNEAVPLEKRLAIARKKAITQEEFDQLSRAYQQ